MPAIPDPQATLICEIGSLMTRVSLIDVVDGQARLVSRVEVASSIAAPQRDALVAVLEGAQQIGDVVGRRLVHAGNLIIPRDAEGQGVDALVAVTSIAEPLNIAVAAIAHDVSAQSALRACRAVPHQLRHTLTFDAPGIGRIATAEWLDRELAVLTRLPLDCVVLAGGHDGGAREPLVRLAHVIGLAIDRTPLASSGVAPIPVIYAGNQRVARAVAAVLGEQTALHLAENVRPAADLERLDGARQALAEVYAQRVRQSVSECAGLLPQLSAPLCATIEGQGIMARYIAEQHGRAVCAIDIGGSGTTILLANEGRYVPAWAPFGSRQGNARLVGQAGLAALARWLPFVIDERTLWHHLLNVALRPLVAAATREAALIDLALAREIIRAAWEALGDEAESYDFVIAAGGIFAHAPHPGHVALAVLDALPSPDPGATAIFDLHLDAFGLMASTGALARSDPAAALSLFEYDLLQNTPLATCVIPPEGGRVGKPALDLELTLENGTAQRISVAYGDLVRIPAAAGARGTLTIRQAGGSRVLRTLGRRGREEREEFIDGSVLGIIVDARPRPLLPADDTERRDVLWQWLVALGTEQGDLPYDAVAITPGAHAAGEIVVGHGGARRDRETSVPGEALPPETPAATARRRLGRS
jgi:hypothetical protein